MPKRTKDRGILLTLYTALGILSHTLSLIVFIFPINIQMATYYQFFSPIMKTWSLTLTILLIISFVAIWRWKRWGVYLRGALLIASAIDLLLIRPILIKNDIPLLTTSIALTINWFIFYWVIQRKWKGFS